MCVFVVREEERVRWFEGKEWSIDGLKWFQLS